MTKMKAKVKEGDLCAVPLNDGGYGVGLIARKNDKIVLGYFFSYISSNVPIDIPPAVLGKKNVILIAKFSSLRIDSGDWPIIGNPIPFVKSDWPIPIFRHRDDIVGVYRARILGEDLFTAREYIISDEEADKLYQDGLFGAVALASRLNRVLKPYREMGK
jgi:hypothetical protein